MSSHSWLKASPIILPKTVKQLLRLSKNMDVSWSKILELMNVSVMNLLIWWKNISTVEGNCLTMESQFHKYFLTKALKLVQLHNILKGVGITKIYWTTTLKETRPIPLSHLPSTQNGDICGIFRPLMRRLNNSPTMLLTIFQISKRWWTLGVIGWSTDVIRCQKWLQLGWGWKGTLSLKCSMVVGTS